MKKFLILLLAMLLMLTVAAAEDTVTTYDFESGVPGVFLQSGSASPKASSTVAHGGASSLQVTNRSGNDYDAVDLNAKALGMNINVPAKITAWIYVDSDESGTFRIAKSGGDYATLGSVNCPGRTWTQITAEVNEWYAASKAE